MKARVTLRPLRPEDVTRAYEAWFREPEVKRWIAFAKRRSTRRVLIDYIRERHGNPDVMLWGIFVHGHHVGNIKAERPPLYRSKAVLGLMIGERRLRGMGVGPAAIRQAARWCFRHWKVGLVAAGVHPFNTRSMRAFEKADFKVADLDPPRVWLHLEKP